MSEQFKIGDVVWLGDLTTHTKPGQYVVHRLPKSREDFIWIRYPSLECPFPATRSQLFRTQRKASLAMARECEANAERYANLAAELRRDAKAVRP